MIDMIHRVLTQIAPLHYAFLSFSALLLRVLEMQPDELLLKEAGS